MNSHFTCSKDKFHNSTKLEVETEHDTWPESIRLIKLKFMWVTSYPCLHVLRDDEDGPVLGADAVELDQVDVLQLGHHLK